MKKVTMQTIADYLNISKSLVSLALNDKYGVSSEMRFKVFNAAVELGYNFNYNYKEKNIKNRKQIIVYVKKESLVRNPYWNELIQGSEKLLSEENMKFIIIVWDKDTTDMEFLESALSGTVEGVLIIDELKAIIFETLKKLNIPMIIVDGKTYLDKEFDNVRTNNYLGGFLAAEYLYNMGHKNISFVGNKDFSISFKERYYGFMNYIDEHDDLNYMGTIDQSTYDISSEFTAESNIIKVFKNENRPTALFCANDHIAIFVYEELNKIGLKPYKDVSIIGFDDIEESNKLDPPLTSIKVKINELGKTAVAQLLNRIKYKDSPKKSILLSVVIDEKKSVRRL